MCEQRGHFLDLRVNDPLREFLLKDAELDLDNDEENFFNDLESYRPPVF